MEEKIDKHLEEILKTIEFPGEEGDKIARYLTDRDFADLVVKAIHQKNARAKWILFWLVFIILNILVLSVLGTNDFIINEFFAVQNSLSVLFFLFLGVSLFGGLVGLIIYIDPSWFRDIHDWIEVMLKRGH